MQCRRWQLKRGEAARDSNQPLERIVTTPTVAPPSAFITVLAWVLIVLHGFGILSALMQNVMINVVFSSMADSAAGAGQEIDAAGLLFMRVLGLLFLGFTVFLMYTAYALLKRRNWARRTYIVLFSLGIAFNVLMVVVLGIVAVLFPSVGTESQAAEAPVMFSAFAVVFGIVAIVFSALFGWLVWRLRSPGIRVEFVGATGAR